MPNYQLLNNVDHGSLKVITKRGARYGDNLMFVTTFPIEMRAVQAHYPILLHKQPNSGQFTPIALFGFEEGENLFLDGESWRTPYIPMMIRRSPFLIGFHRRNPGAARERVVTIDLDSPRVSEHEGTALFLRQGGNSEFLEGIANMLETIHNGHEQNAAFVEALLEHELIEGITLDIRLHDQSRNQLQGMYGLNDERLQQLSVPALGRLNSAGFLLPAYMMLASQSQLGRLVDLRNARLANA